MKKTFYMCVLALWTALGQAQTPYIDSLVRIVAKHQRDTNEIKTLNLLANELVRSDVDRAIGYTYQQLALAKALNTDIGLSAAYASLVTRNQNLGRLDSARYYLDLEEAVFRRNPDNPKWAANFYNSAGLFYRNRGEYTKSTPYLLEALRYTIMFKDKTQEAGQRLNLGNTYNRMGDLTNAAVYHLKALQLFEEVKNKRGQSFCLQSLGNDYLALKQYKAAEQYFFQSEKMKVELGDKRGLVSSWMSLGAMYMEQEKYEKAFAYNTKAVAMARETKTIIEEAGALFNLARIYRDTKRHDEALLKYNESLILAKQSADSLLANRINTDLALMDNTLKKEERALLEHVEISLESGDRTTSADGYNKLATWYAEHKQYEKAYQSMMQFQQLNDSIRGNAILVQFKNLEEQYESEKKEKEITLLKKDQELQNLALSRTKFINTSIGIALISVIIIAFLLINRYRVVNKAKRLVEIERVRNNIARDLHDDIGSTLSSINILSQVALQEKNGSTENYLQRIGDQSARIMENMGDMVWSINPRNDSMAQIVVKMREFATEILEPQSIEFEFHEKVSDSLIINTDKRKNLFLIFKETLNNAAKYSKANRVKISLQQKDHSIVLHVKDDGIGFDETVAKSGNGLRNLRERAREVNGNVTISSAIGQGTDTELVLPLT